MSVFDILGQNSVGGTHGSLEAIKVSEVQISRIGDRGSPY
jgi:hypothetical protein